jgi:hypothetical protein
MLHLLRFPEGDQMTVYTLLKDFPVCRQLLVTLLFHSQAYAEALYVRFSPQFKTNRSSHTQTSDITGHHISSGYSGL